MQKKTISKYVRGGRGGATPPKPSKIKGIFLKNSFRNTAKRVPFTHGITFRVPFFPALLGDSVLKP
jgi:hypothetical protein